MSKHTNFVFNGFDFMTGTMHMKDHQVGKYIRLLCYQSDKLRIPKDVFDSIADGDSLVSKKFLLDENGEYFNSRLEKELKKMNIIPIIDERKEIVTHVKENLVTLPFETETFKQKWAEWLAYKKEIGDPYSTGLSERTALKHLSYFDETFCTHLIETSITKGWKSLIFHQTPIEYNEYLEQKKNGNKPTLSHSTTKNQRRDDHFKRELESIINQQQQSSSGGNNRTDNLLNR